jgi:hypothetical protein
MGENFSARRLLVGLTVMFLLAGCAAGATPTPPPTPMPTAMATPTQSPTLAPTPTQSLATPAPPASPSSAPQSHWPYTSSSGITDALFGEDGRVVLAEGDGRVTVLDGNGSSVPGWPWAPGTTGDGAPRVVFGPDGSLYVAVRVGTEVYPATYTWALHRLDPDGKEMAGFPVDLPPMPSCDLAVNGADAFVSCQDENEETGNATVVTIVQPDGSTRNGWPVRMTGLFNSAGFGPDGRVYLSAWYGEPGGKITALASNGTVVAGWPRKIGGEGEPGVQIDAQGRVRLTSSRDVAQEQCGLPAQTVYTMLQADGSTAPGWPVTVKGWSSEPQLAADGTMVVAAATGKVTAYSSLGVVQDGWPVSKVDVNVECTGGSQPWAAGDGTTVVLGDDHATLLAADGKVASGWPVTLPYGPADSCGFACTPGGSGPMEPAVGERAVYIGAYQGDAGGAGTEGGTNTVQPRVMVVERDGSMPSDAQVPLGKVGDTLSWLRIAPTGRVWALTASTQEDEEAGTLHLVAEDTALGS